MFWLKSHRHAIPLNNWALRTNRVGAFIVVHGELGMFPTNNAAGDVLLGVKLAPLEKGCGLIVHDNQLVQFQKHKQ